MISLEQRLKIDTYQENGYTVFTERAHLKRGSCCGSQCRHCPYEPRHQLGAKQSSLRL